MTQSNISQLFEDIDRRVMSNSAQVSLKSMEESGHKLHHDAEAARYSILRRLAPALKHDMVVNLQAVSMMAEVLAARLEKGLLPSAELQKNISKINRLARGAVATCLKVTEWIEPAEDEGVRLRDGVSECVALMQSSFNFRGFSINNTVPETEFEVCRAIVRNLLAASLFVLTDAAAGACEVMIEAKVVDGFAELKVCCMPCGDPSAGRPVDVSYRPLEWSDIQALAAAESIQVDREGNCIVMAIPRLVPMIPLRIVPL